MRRAADLIPLFREHLANLRTSVRFNSRTPARQCREHAFDNSIMPHSARPRAWQAMAARARQLVSIRRRSIGANTTVDEAPVGHSSLRGVGGRRKRQRHRVQAQPKATWHPVLVWSLSAPRQAIHALICALLCALLGALGTSTAFAHTPARLPALRAVVRATVPTSSVPTLAIQRLATPTPVAPRPAASPSPAPLAPAIDFAIRDFETGVAFPRWSRGGYSGADGGWQVGLNEIQHQTSAGWVEMMIQLYQDYQSSTSVHTGAATPAPQSLAAGIRTAHSMGLHVFIVPLLGVLYGQPWGGAIHFASYTQTRAWFASYWRALQPYMAAASDTGAEQFAIGTELSALELADSSLWYGLLASAHATFRGKLTYDINWSTLGAEPRGWMRDSRLSYLGVSEYAPLAAGSWRLSAEQIGAVWQQRLLPSLQALSSAAGKPVLLSEIGYRNARDALYRPWDHSSRARQDPELQASAYTQALRAVYGAPSIAGIFFWAWSVDQFAPNGLPAAQVLRTYYGYYQVLARRMALRRRNQPDGMDGLLP